MYKRNVQQIPLLVDTYGTEEFSISPRFCANYFWSPCKFSALTSTPLYSSTPTSTSLYSGINRLYDICAEPCVRNYSWWEREGLSTHMYSRNVQQNPLLVDTYGTEEFSISPRFCANDFWSPCKFSAFTSTPLYSSTPTSTYLYSGINRLYAQNPVFEIVHDESVKAYLHICTAGMFSRTLYW